MHVIFWASFNSFGAFYSVLSLSFQSVTILLCFGRWDGEGSGWGADRGWGITDWQRKERKEKKKGKGKERKIMMTGDTNVSQAEVRCTGEKMDFRKKGLYMFVLL